MEAIKKMLKKNTRQYAMLIALVAVLVIFQIATNGIMLMPLNITNLILQNAHIIILAIGMLFVIVGGDFDLSVGSLAGLVGAIVGILAVTMKVNPILAICIGLGVGALAGMWQGMWIAYFRVPAFVVTLGGMMIFRGLMLRLLDSKSIGPFPDMIQKLSSGFIPDAFHLESLKLTTLIVGVFLAALYIGLSAHKRNKQRRLQLGTESMSKTLFVVQTALIAVVIIGLCLVLAAYDGIPNVLIVLAILLGIYSFVANRSVFGRRVYALGGNERATALSGINTKKVKFIIFINMGVLAAVAGIIYAARLNYATPQGGDGFELDAIAACYIGGASSSGGIGTIMGALIGALVMGVLNNGMSILGFGVDIQQIIKGLVLIFAVLFDVMTKSKVATA
ncbi:multiple monosaccharide ABC transporter permease [Christensenella timonensis]|uniref:multiple monosaccharide ABC transporter permease n=1 Tax=Christensenella timonensis TaxID=1816678 RepID=UPI000836A1D7|nr:multiple monosaccharide ABC transporter permease [Christensenella timonensis]